MTISDHCFKAKVAKVNLNMILSRLNSSNLFQVLLRKKKHRIYTSVSDKWNYRENTFTKLWLAIDTEVGTTVTKKNKRLENSEAIALDFVIKPIWVPILILILCWQPQARSLMPLCLSVLLVSWGEQPYFPIRAGKEWMR